MTEWIRSREELENRIIGAYRAGQSKRSLAREFRMSRNTVRRILRNHKQQRGEEDALVIKKHRIPRERKIDRYLDQIKQLLERYPKITGVRIMEEIKAAGYDGGITQLRETVSKLRPKPKREPIIRFNTAPGRQGQMDWSFYNLTYSDGKREMVCCFAYYLKYSRRFYVDFCLKRNFHSMIRRHRDAFEYFGGVPQECLYDGERTVLLRWEAGRPVYNPAFVNFLTHYGCRPVGCRPGRPQTKGGVEACFRLIEGNLLNGRTFRNLDDLRTYTRVWMKEFADCRIHRETGRMPLALFEQEERDALQELPPRPYDTSQVIMVVADREARVSFQSNKYSVPFDFVGHIMTVKISEEEIRIFDSEVHLIAVHQRRPDGKGAVVRDPSHQPTRAPRYGLEPVREAFLALGTAAADFLKGLERHHPRRCGYYAREILSYKECYHSDDINRALAHASAYNAFEAAAIARILKAKMTRRTLESYTADAASKLLGEHTPTIGQRDLDKYDTYLADDPKKE